MTGCGETRTFEGTGSRFTCAWKDAKLWDTDTPENRYEATVAAYDAGGNLIDETLPHIKGCGDFGEREKARISPTSRPTATPTPVRQRTRSERSE